MLKKAYLSLVILASLLTQIKTTETAQTFKQKFKPLINQVETPGKWIALSTGATSIGAAELITIDSTNSPVDFRIYNYGDGICFMRSYVNGRFYGLNIITNSQLRCSQTIISKISSTGQVLFVDPFKGVYSYITESFNNADIKTVQGSTNIASISAADVEIAVTKTTASSNQANDAFRIYSKASDVNGKYPQNFYTLVSDAGPNGFIQSASSSLTLKKTDWNYTTTSNTVEFDQIEAVNFVSIHSPNSEYEGQFIIGKNKGQSNCLFGVVDTYRFFQGKAKSQQMYAGTNKNQDFSCGEEQNFQGFVSENSRLAFSYSINKFSGEIVVCVDLPAKLREVQSVQDFGKICGRDRQNSLVLANQEYYSGVNAIQNDGSFLSVVNIRIKGSGASLRQVLVDFGYGNNLPTFDTATYFYTASAGKVWRMKKKYPRNSPIQVSYFKPGQGVSSPNEELTE